MSTTIGIAEILIVGVFTLSWILLGVLRLSSIDFASLKVIAAELAPWSTGILFVLVAWCYQVGLFVDLFTYWALKRWSSREINVADGDPVDYDKARIVVYQYGSVDLLKSLYDTLSFVRLARSGIVNLTMLGIIVMSFGLRYLLLGAFLFILGILCFPLWKRLSARYYSRISDAYTMLHGFQEDSRKSSSP